MGKASSLLKALRSEGSINRIQHLPALLAILAQAVDSPGSDSFLSVPTPAAFATLSVQGLHDGELCWIDSLNDFAQFFSAPSNTGAANGVTVFATSAADLPNSRWIRLGIPNYQWQNQTAWFLDGTNGSDIAAGSQAAPIKSWDELRRRVGYPMLFLQNTVLQVVTTPGGLLNMELDEQSASVRVDGTPVTVASDDVTAVTSQNPATNTRSSFTVTDPLFLLKNIVKIDAELLTFATVGLATSTSVAALTRPYNIDSQIDAPFPIVTDTLSNVTMPVVNVGIVNVEGQSVRFRMLDVQSASPSTARGVTFEACYVRINTENCSMYACSGPDPAIHSKATIQNSTLSSSIFEDTDFSDCCFVSFARFRSGRILLSENNWTELAATELSFESACAPLLFGANSLFGSLTTILEPGVTVCMSSVTACTVANANAISFLGADAADVFDPRTWLSATPPVAAACTTFTALNSGTFDGYAISASTRAGFSIR